MGLCAFFSRIIASLVLAIPLTCGAAERPTGNRVRFEMSKGARFKVEIHHTFSSAVSLDRIRQVYLVDEMAALPGGSNTIKGTWFDSVEGTVDRAFVLRIGVATENKNIVSVCRLTQSPTGFMRDCPLAFDRGDTAAVFERRTPGKIVMKCEKVQNQIDCMSSMEGEAKGFSFLFFSKSATDMATAYSREWIHDFATFSMWAEGDYSKSSEAKAAFQSSSRLWPLAKEIERRADEIARKGRTASSKPLVITATDMVRPLVSVLEPTPEPTQTIVAQPLDSKPNPAL
jgi:hypothetical protein